MLKQIRDKIWHRDFKPDDVDKYVGQFQKTYFAYATDSAVRAKAASGGSVSGLLIYLLESGQIDGALVCRTIIKDEKVRAEFFIATSREQILSAQGSKYVAVYFSSEALPLIRAFEGRLGVVALPCDAKILRHYRDKHPEVDQKIALVITLFCGHNSEPELVDTVVERLRKEHGAIQNYTFRSGHWRGELTATYQDGTSVTKPFAYFSDYRNVYFFAQKKCHHCHDHFGYFCDISAGDIWSPEMKDAPVKHTALIARSDAGVKTIEAAMRDGALHGKEEGVLRVMNGQARTLPFHYNVTARKRAGRLFGLEIRDEVNEKVRWNEYLVAFFALLGQRVSQTGWGQKLILHIPRPLLKLYLYVFKGLESF